MNVQIKQINDEYNSGEHHYECTDYTSKMMNTIVGNIIMNVQIIQVK